MTSLENKDTVQRNHEASIKSLQHEAPYFESFPQFQDNINAQSVVDPMDIDCPLTSGPGEPSNESTEKQLYSHEHFANPGCHAAVVCQPNAFHGHFHPFALNNRFQHAPLNLLPPQRNYPHNQQFQDFEYFVVIDFEATCDKEKNPYPQEIIEFPSVIVSSMTGQLAACFQTYVRPTCNQHLTDFCKDLTGIQQLQVDRGVTLSEALVRHDEWLEKNGLKNTNFAVVTWSDWDCRVMLESECRFKNIRKPPYFNRWIDLRVGFDKVFGAGRCTLKEAVEKAGLAWEGRAHSGMDDAKNTARLLALLMHKGFKFSITNSLTNAWRPPANHIFR